MRNKAHRDPLPEEFRSYEEAAEFWDTHDTTDYADDFETVDAQVDFISAIMRWSLMRIWLTFCATARNNPTRPCDIWSATYCDNSFRAPHK